MTSQNLACKHTKTRRRRKERERDKKKEEIIQSMIASSNSPELWGSGSTSDAALSLTSFLHRTIRLPRTEFISNDELNIQDILLNIQGIQLDPPVDPRPPKNDNIGKSQRYQLIELNLAQLSKFISIQVEQNQQILRKLQEIEDNSLDKRKILSSEKNQIKNEFYNKFKGNKPYSYDGKDNPDSWIFDMETYFKLNNAPAGEYSVLLASTYLISDAQLWWRLHCQEFPPGHHSRITEWEDFINNLRLNFKPLNFEKINRDHLTNLNQTGSAKKYINEFRRLAFNIPSMPTNELLYKFLYGCKPSVKLELEKAQALGLCTTLEQTIQMAEQMDNILFQASKSNYKFQSKNILNNKLKKQTKSLSFENKNKVITNVQKFQETQDLQDFTFKRMLVPQLPCIAEHKREIHINHKIQSPQKPQDPIGYKELQDPKGYQKPQECHEPQDPIRISRTFSTLRSNRIFRTPRSNRIFRTSRTSRSNRISRTFSTSRSNRRSRNSRSNRIFKTPRSNRIFRTPRSNRIFRTSRTSKSSRISRISRTSEPQDPIGYLEPQELSRFIGY